MNIPRIQDVFPLSASQLGMWLQSAADASGQSFVEQVAFRLDGPLDATALHHAWQLLIDRHAALRSAFVAKGDAPKQVVMAQVRLPLQTVDADPQADEAAHVEQLLAAQRAQGFAPNRPPLIRCALLRVSAERHWWVVGFHHLILDGWSLAVLWHEAQAAYRALAAGQTPQLPPAPDYRHYAAWLQSRATAADEAYWRQRLAGFTAANPIAPLAHASALQQEVSHLCSPAAGAALAAAASACRLPPAMVLEVLWALLLAGRCGQRDVVFGVTVSGRPAEVPGIAGLVGCFINTVPVRLRLDTNAPLRDCLREHHAARAEQGPHEYCASGQIHAWSALPPGQPLYASLLVVENLPAAAPSDSDAAAADLRIGEQRVAGGRSALPLSLLVSPGAAPHLRFIHQPQAVPGDAVEALAREFERLLAELPHRLEQPLEGLLASIAPQPLPPPLASVGLPPRPLHIAPRTALEHALQRIWQDLFGRDDIGVLDDFLALGGHSLMALQMASRIRQTLGLDCPLHRLIEAPTIERLALILPSQASTPSARIALASGGASGHSGVPVVCLHPLGGHVLCYAALGRALAGRHPCWGLQAPGLHAPEVPAPTWDALVEHHWQLLPRDGAPLVLLGYSYGGYIAMELAQRLQQDGLPPPATVLLDVPHPSAIPPDLLAPDRATLLHSLFGPVLGIELPALQALPESALLPHVHALAIDRHVLPPGTSLPELERLLAVAHGHSRLAPPPRRYGFPALLLRAREGAGRITDREDMGWRAHVPALTLRWVDGSHETMLDAPHIPALLSALEDVLSAPQAAPAQGHGGGQRV